jgi:hypothetical protein
MVDQFQTSQRELAGVLSSLIDAHRATADRLTALTSRFDGDTTQRTEDVELIVDTVTTGWEGLAAAVKALYEQGADNARRIAGIEQRLGQIRDLEGAIEKTMFRFDEHVKNLQPAPVVVTVSHADAEVHNTTRPGWVPNSSS